MAIQSPPQSVKRLPAFTPRMLAFLVGWFFGWPLVIFAYNPLAAPYEPLTLLLVIPGGAIWLWSCILGCAKLTALADTRWPAAKIPEILRVVPDLFISILSCIP
jgi:hypothetical protein